MLAWCLRVGLAVLLAGAGVCALAGLHAQDGQAPPPGEPPPVPQGVEVLARGPIHEAFASLTAEPAPTKPVPRKPPAPLEEMPPDQKPEGDVVWIGGYWAWDDERSDFLWVSGTWRTPPPGKQWVAGYWREEGEQWQWVPGFWTAAAKEEAQQVTYLPEPPKPPPVAPPGEPPSAESFYVPGYYVWTGNVYAWHAGYWARVVPGYVWVPAHYRWTPTGYVFIPGYWDLAIKRRGVLYAPVVISPTVVTVGFTYTPCYAVADTLVVDHLFVRPAYCHYYFGDYYGPTYVGLGFENCVVYSRHSYDSIIVYERWEHRSEPNWFSLQINVYNDRSAGRLALPPRTLVQQNTYITQNNIVQNNIVQNNIVHNTIVQNNTTNVYLAPTNQVLAAKQMRTVTLDNATRVQARQQAQVVQQVAYARVQNEVPVAPGALRQPRSAALPVPRAQPVKPGMVVPRAPTLPTGPASAHLASPNPGASRPPAVGTAAASPANSRLATPAPRTSPVTSTQRPATPPPGNALRAPASAPPGQAAAPGSYRGAPVPRGPAPGAWQAGGRPGVAPALRPVSGQPLARPGMPIPGRPVPPPPYRRPPPPPSRQPPPKDQRDQSNGR